MISPRLHHSGVRITNRPDSENVGRLNHAAWPMVMSMMDNGVRIDKSHLLRLKSTLLSSMQILAANIQESTGETDINLASPEQVARLVFDVLHLTQPGREKKTKSRTRLSADADVLKSMRGMHPCINQILEWHEQAKLLSTYTDSLIAQLDDNDRVHSKLSLTRTDTNRIASSEPNLQNISVRTKLGKEVRKAFVPKVGNVIGSCDAGQIEMRMNAVDSNCQGLLQCFWSWGDIYWDAAEIVNHRVFSTEEREHGVVESGSRAGLSYKEVYRQDSKRVALMVGYDSSPGGVYDRFLADGVEGFTEEDVAAMIVDYFNGYPELLVARKIHHRRAFQYGFVWDCFGFIRHIPQVKSCHRRIVNEGLRQAGNLAGQGGAAGLVKLWMALIFDRYDTYWRKHGVMVLMQIHDEILCEGPEQVLKDFFEECIHIFRNMVPYQWFPCPLEASYGTGNSWGECSH
jgi:DNA polymerase-1